MLFKRKLEELKKSEKKYGDLLELLNEQLDVHNLTNDDLSIIKVIGDDLEKIKRSIIELYKDIERNSCFEDIDIILEKLLSLMEGEVYLKSKLNNNSKSIVIASQSINLNEYENIEDVIKTGKALVISGDTKVEWGYQTFKYNDELEFLIEYGKFGYVKNFVEELINYKMNNNKSELTFAEIDELIKKFLAEELSLLIQNYELRGTEDFHNYVINILDSVENRRSDRYKNLREFITSDSNIKMLVNKDNPLNKDFIPKDLVLIKEPKENKLNMEAYVAFKLMQLDASNLGYQIFVDSAYQSFEYQDDLLNNFFGSLKDDAYKVCALPGMSEHQIGLAIDITYLCDGKLVEDIDEFAEEVKWLVDNSYKYGYILRYPKDKEEITGINYEPWHYRYVGVELANELYNNGETLEEYYERIKNEKLVLNKKCQK